MVGLGALFVDWLGLVRAPPVRESTGTNPSPWRRREGNQPEAPSPWRRREGNQPEAPSPWRRREGNRGTLSDSCLEAPKGARVMRGVGPGVGRIRDDRSEEH